MNYEVDVDKALEKVLRHRYTNMITENIGGHLTKTMKREGELLSMYNKCMSFYTHPKGLGRKVNGNSFRSFASWLKRHLLKVIFISYKHVRCSINYNKCVRSYTDPK